MLKSYRCVIAAAGIIFLSCIGIGLVIWPTRPVLEPYSYGDATNARYRAGGSKCDPSTLTHLKKGRDATRQVDDCAKEAEDYRQQTNDLIQQTRAANAAEAQTALSYQSGWNSFFQTIGGFLTLIAAGLAAKYARDAAVETRRSADVAHNGWLAERIRIKEDREPKFQVPQWRIIHTNAGMKLGCEFFDVGRSLAINTKIDAVATFRLPHDIGHIVAFDYQFINYISHETGTKVIGVSGEITFCDDHLAMAGAGKPFNLTIRSTISFETEFHERITMISNTLPYKSMQHDHAGYGVVLADVDPPVIARESMPSATGA